MKRIRCGIMTTLILLLASLAAYANDVGKARLSLMQGDVVVSTPDTGGDWVAASINLPLFSGDRIWVPPDGRSEIQFIGRTFLRADGSTDITLTRAAWDRDSTIIQTAVPEGRVYVNFRSSSGRNSVFQADTPLVSVMAYDDALFNVDVWEDGYTEVSVLGGAVYVDTPNGKTTVSRGNMLSVGRERYAALSPLGPRSEWIRWNQSRDSQIVYSRTSSRYLPPELDIYSSDFDEYGRWVYLRDYGYVWNPTVVVSDWAPYRHGRWVWMRGDYVWISYDSWGWAPHHYGRWSFRVGIGWFWVPPAINAVYWSPGFVAWIQTPTYVSWVPLAPRELYYGYGYYGPHSVNVTKVNIKTVNITNVYVNSRVTNAVTVVHRDTFLTGKKLTVAGKPSNPFVHGVRVSPGRPDIRPVKATLLPRPEKVVPQRSLPSQRVIEKVKRSGIQKRPVAVKKDTPVFRHEGRQAVTLPVKKSDRPKPVLEKKRQDKASAPVRAGEITERPQPALKAPVRKTIETPGKRKGAEQKNMKEKPLVTPRPGALNEHVPKSEAGKVARVQPVTKESPVPAGRKNSPKENLIQSRPKAIKRHTVIPDMRSSKSGKEGGTILVKRGEVRSQDGKHKGAKEERAAKSARAVHDKAPRLY